jgi:hypothetical protein
MPCLDAVQMIVIDSGESSVEGYKVPESSIMGGTSRTRFEHRLAATHSSDATQNRVKTGRLPSTANLKYTDEMPLPGTPLWTSPRQVLVICQPSTVDIAELQGSACGKVGVERIDVEAGSSSGRAKGLYVHQSR